MFLTIHLCVICAVSRVLTKSIMFFPARVAAGII
jgi:hypothetical protein